MTKLAFCFCWAAITSAAVGVPSYRFAVYVSHNYAWGPIFLIPALAIVPFLWFVIYYKGIKAFQIRVLHEDAPYPRSSAIVGAVLGILAVCLATAICFGR